MSRRTRDRFVPRKVRDVEALISFILERHSVGLLVLVGDEPWPSTSELYEMAAGESRGEQLDVRVQGGESVPEGQRVLERVEFYERAVCVAGGVERITSVFRDLRETSRREWTMLRDSAMIRRGRPYVSMDRTARAIARRHHMHEDTLRRNRIIIIQRLAFEICYPGFDYMRRGQGMAV